MNTNSNRLLSSEYIKISNSISEDIYSDNRSAIEFDTINNDIIIDSFVLVIAPSLKLKKLFGHPLPALFHAGVMAIPSFTSLKEKELSKSPIILKLYERNLYPKEGEESRYPVDEKKIWILRRGIMVG